MEQNVTWSGDGVAASWADLSKRMKFTGTRRAKELVPCLGAESNDASQARFDIPKFNRTYQPCKICKKRSQDRVIVMLGRDANNQKNCRARERTDHRLWKNDFVERLGYIHLFNLYSQSFSILPRTAFLH